MGTDISVRKDNYNVDHKDWLGSAHGTNATRSVTLDTTLFPDATWALDGDRRHIPSGIMLGRVTATGMYGPYSDIAVDGRQTLAGVLFDGVRAKSSTVAGARVGAAMLEHGVVVEARLPANHGLDANGRTDVAGRIIFR
jgi:hypothetical protein